MPGTPTTTEIPRSSRAACLVQEKAPLEIREVPIPDDIEPGAILVRTECASLCGSDVHIQEGDVGGIHFPLPVILGHEMAGRIVRLGEGVTHDSAGTPIVEGDRIVWTHESCGSCFACVVQGIPTLCSKPRRYMMVNCEDPPYLVGGFSEYCYVFPKSGRIRIPDRVSSQLASAASCALRTVVHGFDRIGRIQDHETVVIQGAGPLGLFSTAMAVAAGAHQVIVIGAPAARLEVASRFGAHRTIDIDEMRNPGEREELIREWTGGRGGDIVIEASGGATAFPEGVGIAARGGRYAVIGQLGKHEVSINPATIVMKQLSILGVVSGYTEHYYKALQFVEHNLDRFPFEDMLSNEYPLERINEAMDAMKGFREVKPLIVFD